MSSEQLPQPAILNLSDTPALVQHLAIDVAGRLSPALSARGRARRVPDAPDQIRAPVAVYTKD